MDGFLWLHICYFSWCNGLSKVRVGKLWHTCILLTHTVTTVRFWGYFVTLYPATDVRMLHVSVGRKSLLTCDFVVQHENGCWELCVWCGSGNLKEVDNWLCSKANSASYRQWKRKWVVARLVRSPETVNSESTVVKSMSEFFHSESK